MKSTVTFLSNCIHIPSDVFKNTYFEGHFVTSNIVIGRSVLHETQFYRNYLNIHVCVHAIFGRILIKLEKLRTIYVLKGSFIQGSG